MSIKHLRDNKLDAVDSLEQFETFCERFADKPLNGSKTDCASFELRFRHKAQKYGMDLDIAEGYLAIMRGHDIVSADETSQPTVGKSGRACIDGGWVPLDGA